MKQFFCSILITLFHQNAQSQLIFLSKEVSRIEKNTNYYYQPKAFDSSGKKINYGVNNLPVWLSWNVAAQSISGKTNKAGQYAIDIIAYTNSDTIHQHFMLTVFDSQTTNILCWVIR